MTKKARHIECTLAEYHARSEWSNSQIKTLRESPPLFYGCHVARPPLWPPEEKQCWDLGTVAHACLTSPGGIDGVVVEIPADVLNSQGHRKGGAWLQWKAEHADRLMLTAAEMAGIRSMVRNVYDHPEARKLLRSILHQEHTIVWHDDETGLDFRARPDLICNGDKHGVTLTEFKTTRQHDPRWFGGDAVKFGYHHQLTWYEDGLEAFGYPVRDHRIITANNRPAYECRVYRLPDALLELAREENRATRRDLARRLKESDWTDPLAQDVLPVQIPDRAYSDAFLDQAVA
ncbi:MAG TPA: PD-(D/E)XK nuclease-like domain-containing protein [Thermoguttaceae bacterium]|nr:PD-(D/E)XK nuclease-like domain-containing protein [Thermoguttaceae bacterium]